MPTKREKNAQSEEMYQALEAFEKLIGHVGKCGLCPMALCTKGRMLYISAEKSTIEVLKAVRAS